MKHSILSIILLSLGCVFSSEAQRVDISPIPQIVKWGGKAFDSSSATYKLSGTPDEATRRLLMNELPGLKQGKNGKTEIVVGKKGEKKIASVASRIPEKSEGYYLSVTPKKIVIAGADESGCFYGAQTLLKILSSPEVMEVEVTDYPMTSWRGVIEGFYGNPWSFEDRVSQFDFYGENKLNVYVYGPKDDPYHHSRWYEPYPEAEAEKISRLVKHAADNKVKFIWAMHPSNSIVTAEDRQKALEKFNQMYDLGVRSFAIFFDDISAKSVNDQVSYLNFLTDEFVNKKKDVEPLTVCPTQYNKAWTSGDYLSTMGNGLYDDIKIMWTGNTVVDMIQTPDCTWFTEQTGRKPFIWLNYPVNDYGQHNLLMGPVVDNGKDVYNEVSAFCSNPMQYAEASKVALYSLADYWWNPVVYDADSDWERSMEVLMPGHAAAFRQFCIDNVDPAPNGHRLRLYGESPEFKRILNSNPNLDERNAELFKEYFSRMDAAANELLALKDNRMIDEIREFVEYYGIQARQGILAADMAVALDKDGESFLALYGEYKRNGEQMDKIVSRGFEGSIQSVKPHTASLHIEPFLKKSVAGMVDRYKRSGKEYPQGLFPEQTVENGLYYIKIGDKYLSNVNGSKFPTLQSELDVVNPGRQLWIVKLEPGTDRYSVRNEWDKRYLNELVAFGVNPFEDSWHSFTINKKGDGTFVIRNGGNGGNAFWITDGNRVKTGAEKDAAEFKLEPSAGK